MSHLAIGTRVQLSTGKPRPKRGKWVIAEWNVVNGQGTVEDVKPDYICVTIERRADGTPMPAGYKRTQVIHETNASITVTPL